jgi:hypothetical protein
MDNLQSVFFDVMKKLSSVFTFLFTNLFTNPLGILISIAVLTCIVVIFLAYSVRKASLLSKIAGQKFGTGSVFLSIVESFGKLIFRLIVWLPALAMIVLITMSVTSLGSAIRKVEESFEAAKRIEDLTVLVKNLNRSYRVADIRILSLENSVTRMRIKFYDPSNPDAPIEEKEFSIAGRDIYFDALVLNFDYSRIADGKTINIAIPYRVFSESISQRDGIPLGAQDIMGTPYIFNRADADIYGLAPNVYRARLAEFMELIRDEEQARGNGIIRSVYGSAVHKRVNVGDHFEIRSEQTGGIVLKDIRNF